MVPLDKNTLSGGVIHLAFSLKIAIVDDCPFLAVQNMNLLLIIELLLTVLGSVA